MGQIGQIAGKFPRILVITTLAVRTPP